MSAFTSTEKLKEIARAGAGTFFGLRRLIPRRQGTAQEEKAHPLTAACKSIEENIAKKGRVEELTPELKACFELFAQTMSVDAAQHESTGSGDQTPAQAAGGEGAKAKTSGGALAGSSATTEESTGGGSPTTPPTVTSAPTGGSGPSTPSNSTGAGNLRNFGGNQRAFEGSVLYFMEFLQSLQKSLGVHATKAMVLNSVLNTVVKGLGADPPLPARVTESFLEGLKQYLLLDKHFSSCLQDLCQTLRDGATDNALQLRLLLLLHQVLRSTDLDEVHGFHTDTTTRRSDYRAADSETLKSRLAEHGLIEHLLSRAAEIREQLCLRTPNSPTVDATPMFGVGTLCVCVLLSLARNHPQHKQKLMNHDFFGLWVYFASNSSKLHCTYTFTVTLRESVQQEQTIVYETPGFWYGELAEGLVEVATREQSFALKRQELQAQGITTGGAGGGSASGTSSQNPPPPAGSASTGTGSKATAPLVFQPWVPLPEKWSSVLTSGSMFVWRFSSACVQCLFSEETSRLLLWALGRMSTVSHVASSIYCNVLASVVLLTKASPMNGGILTASGAFKQVIGILSPRSCVFNLEENKEVIVDLHQLSSSGVPSAAAGPGDDPAWEITLALLTALMSTQFATEELTIVMDAIHSMATAEFDDIKGQDCEVIEHCNHVLACMVQSPYHFWFDGTQSKVSAVLQKYSGSWNGYSFSCWLNTVCVWPEGGLLYSFTEPTGTSSLALLVVANGKSKCLAVRSSTQKGEVTITMLPDASLGDDWNHVVIIHNTSMSAWINGKRVFQKKDIPYPKEPTKPHKLTFSVGGDSGEVNIPPIFGMMTSVQLWDTYYEEKQIQSLFAQGPGATQNFDPALDRHLLVGLKPQNPPTLVGHGTQSQASSVRAVFYQQTPSLVQAMTSQNVLNWFGDIFLNATDSENFIGVSILSTQLMAVYLKQYPEARSTWFESKAFPSVASVLRQWECVPHEVLCHVLHLCTSRDSRIVSHPSTAATIQLLLDCVSSPICLGSSAKETQKGVFEELGPLLAAPENARVFRETPRGYAQLLDCAKDLEESCISSFIIVLEKLVREPQEMEHTIKFLVHDPETSRSTIVKCEVLRMLYDIAKPSTLVVDMIVNAGGIDAILMLVHGSIHHSEALRVYALRLLALVIHVSRRARDAFIKNNGFEQLAHSLLRHATAAPIGLPTYNCIFKFGLDVFQSQGGDEVTSSVFTAGNSGNSRTDSGRHLDPTRALGGHLPGIMPKGQAPMMRTFGSATGSNSECSDLEARLSLDDAYNTQISRDKLVYPQCVSIALQLLSQSFNTLGASSGGSPKDQCSVLSAPQLSCENVDEMLSSVERDTSSEVSDTSVNMISRVLSYIDRMCDISQNAAAVLPHAWLEWILAPYLAFLGAEAKMESSSRNQIKTMFCSIVRKLAVADLGRPARQTTVKKVKEMCDVPKFQSLVIAEVVHHFGINNSLDAITDASIAQNCLRNLDSLLQGIDECIQNLGQELCLEIVGSISHIAIHNNNWVRTKMKDGKLFETRNHLAYHMFTTVKNFAVEPPPVLDAIVSTVGSLNDQNVAAYTIKLIIEAVAGAATGGGFNGSTLSNTSSIAQLAASATSVATTNSSSSSPPLSYAAPPNVGEPDIEKLEIMQGIGRTLSEEPEHQRHFVKMLGDQDTVDLLLGMKGDGRSSPGTGGNSTASSQEGTPPPQRLTVKPGTHLISFAQANEKKWSTILSSFHQRYGKKLDADLSNRHDAREKDTNTKLKQRRAEVEKRQTSSARVAADVDKLVSESSLRGATFTKEVGEQRTSKQKRTVDASAHITATKVAQ